MDERVAYLVTDILSDNLARASTFGEGSALRLLSRPAAVKTGTTTDWRDNWTVGYTPDLVVGVWTGNADNEPMQHVSGVVGAAPIWHDVMETLLKGRPVREFVEPPGMVFILDLSVYPPVESQALPFSLPWELDCVREGPLTGLCLISNVAELAVVWLENDGTASVGTPFSFGTGYAAMVSGPAIFP